jgi:hypothetical protein
MGLLDILLKKNLISKDDVNEVKQRVASGDAIDQILIERGVSVEDLLAARGEFLNIPIRTLGDVQVPFEVLEYIPEESASHYKFVPIGIKDNVLEVGIVDPDNIEARDALSFIAAKKNIPYKIFIISIDDFNKVLESYKGLSGEVSKALTELETVLSVDSESTIDKKNSKEGKKDKILTLSLLKTRRLLKLWRRSSAMRQKETHPTCTSNTCMTKSASVSVWTVRSIQALFCRLRSIARWSPASKCFPT